MVMKITEEQYAKQRFGIEDRYIQLAEELTEQMFDCLDWDNKTKEVNAQVVIAIWLKTNELHCIEK